MGGTLFGMWVQMWGPRKNTLETRMDASGTNDTASARCPSHGAFFRLTSTSRTCEVLLPLFRYLLRTVLTGVLCVFIEATQWPGAVREFDHHFFVQCVSNVCRVTSAVTEQNFIGIVLVRSSISLYFETSLGGLIYIVLARLACKLRMNWQRKNVRGR